MANGYVPDSTGYLIPGLSSGRVRGYIDYSQSTDSTSSTISVLGIAQEIYSYQYDVTISVAIDMPLGSGLASQSATARLNTNPGGTWRDVVTTPTATATVQRTTQTQTAYIRAMVSVPSGGTSWQTIATISIPGRIDVPTAPTGLTNTRVNDNRNNLSWTNRATTYGIYTNLIVRRSVDGGGYSDLATISGSSTSYSDTSTQPNHFYAYQVVAKNSAGQATSNTSSTTYNTPATPTNLVVSRLDATSVKISFTNTAVTETSINVQRSTNLITWTSLTAVSGHGITQITDTPGGGSFYYRLQAARGSLVSAWSEPSDVVVTICPPAAPTLISPVNGAVIKVGNDIFFQWVHNPLDGSEQTVAEIALSYNNGTTFSTMTITGSTQQTSLLYNYPANTTVTWKVRTKGADATFSPWSELRAFVLRQAPQVTITYPSQDGETVTTMPLNITWGYDDISGTQQSALLAINSPMGQELWSRQIEGSATSYSLEPSEYLPDNHESFVITLLVQSTSTLSATTKRTFTTNYAEPAEPELYLDIDERLGTVTALLVAVSQSGKPATTAMELIRHCHDEKQVCIGTNLKSGQSIVDLFAPTDIDIEYTAIARASTGALSKTVCHAYLKSYGAVFYNFGEDYTKVAKLVTDPSQTEDSNYDKTVFYTAGSSDPLVFYGENYYHKGRRAGTVLPEEGIWPTRDDPSSLQDIYYLKQHKGDVVMRLPGIHPMMADITVSIDTSARLAKVSIPWQEVRGHGLAL